MLEIIKSAALALAIVMAGAIVIIVVLEAMR